MYSKAGSVDSVSVDVSRKPETLAPRAGDDRHKQDRGTSALMDWADFAKAEHDMSDEQLLAALTVVRHRIASRIQARTRPHERTPEEIIGGA